MTVQQTKFSFALSMTGFIPSLQVVVSSGVHFKKMKEEVNLLSFRFLSANNYGIIETDMLGFLSGSIPVKVKPVKF